MYSNRFLSRGFTDQCEILHGGSATSRTGLLLFSWIAPWMAEFWRDMAGYASWLEALVFLLISSASLKSDWIITKF